MRWFGEVRRAVRYLTLPHLPSWSSGAVVAAAGGIVTQSGKCGVTSGFQELKSRYLPPGAHPDRNGKGGLEIDGRGPLVPDARSPECDAMDATVPVSYHLVQKKNYYIPGRTIKPHEPGQRVCSPRPAAGGNRPLMLHSGLAIGAPPV